MPNRANMCISQDETLIFQEANMLESNFLETQIEQQHYNAMLENCERYLQFLQQDINSLKSIEQPSHTHFILARILKDKILEATNTLK